MAGKLKGLLTTEGTEITEKFQYQQTETKNSDPKTRAFIIL